MIQDQPAAIAPTVDKAESRGNGDRLAVPYVGERVIPGVDRDVQRPEPMSEEFLPVVTLLGPLAYVVRWVWRGACFGYFNKGAGSFTPRELAVCSSTAFKRS